MAKKAGIAGKKFLRFALVGKAPQAFYLLLRRLGVKPVSHDPDAVIAYGGDGTTLKAEHIFPGIPKICAREWDGCVRCNGKGAHGEAPRRSGNQLCFDCFELTMRRAMEGKVRIVKEIKLTGKARTGSGRTFEADALNEVQLHNLNPMQAIRFDLYLDGKPFKLDCIADGVIISTPYGSTGYYYSVSGGKTFKDGIGIILNNPKKPSKPTIITKNLDNFELRGVVTRTKGLFIADNFPKFVKLVEGDEFTVRKSKTAAKFIV